MIEIIFRNSGDAMSYYKYLLAELASSEIIDKNILQFEDQHIVRIFIEGNTEMSLELVKEVFYKFLVQSKQDDWFRRILIDQYYYQDEDEQQQILEIIHSILEGTREDLEVFVSNIDLKESLKSAVNQMFQDNISFSFESFVKFRMRPLMDHFAKYVEISIDEYKMEQEYQMFIQTLREFLAGRPAKLNHIHLLIDDGIHFFDEDFFEIKRSELTKMIDRKLLFNHPVYVDSVTIAPLLSVAPSAIYLYSDEIEQPLVRTIRNIFEERLVLDSIAGFYNNKRIFPFTADEKM